MLKALSILTVVLTANAYDSFSFVNNKYLLDDFNGLNNVESISRHRRDTDRGSNESDDVGKICCIGDINDSKQNMQNDVIYEQCQTLVKINMTSNENVVGNQINRNNIIIECGLECYFRAKNLIDENGKFNREAIIKNTKELSVRDIDWKKAVFEEYIDDCITKAAANKKLNYKQCSKAAVKFSFCTIDKFFNGCPADLRIHTDMCDFLRNHFSSISQAMN